MIPIENIYYLFCYAWNRFEEAKAIPLGSSPSPDLPNLLGRVMLTGTRRLLRRGLDRDYKEHAEAIATVRGRIELSGTIQLQARSIRRLFCEFDDLSYDLLHNQVIKASLRRLACAPSIEPQLAHDLIRTAQRMSGVSDVHLELSTFSRIQLHRNNAYYDLILKVAKLAFDCLLPDENGGGFAFHDVARDEVKMARIFESFVRNFYATEQSELSIKPLTISWDANPIRTTDTGRLPSMIVDVYLKGSRRNLIIDTKYYANALQRSWHGTESFQSANLYQIFAYLKNAATNVAFTGCEGMLLYPMNGRRLRETFEVQGHMISDYPLAIRNIICYIMDMKKKPITIAQFFRQFPDDETCLQHIFEVRFGQGYECSSCERATNWYRIKAERAYSCQFCGHHLHPTVGTPFEKSRTPLQLWFYAIYLFTTTRHGVPAKELERQLGVTYKTAWRMAGLIREHMADVDGENKLGGFMKTVEIDETYIGGVAHGKGKGYKGNKTAIMGMMERGGEVMTVVIPNRRKPTLEGHIFANVKPHSEIHTDDFMSYSDIGDFHGYWHKTVNHSAGQWVTKSGTTTNGIEGFWSQLKRSINAAHIHVSGKHLWKYAKEAEYRFNRRDRPETMFSELVSTYQPLT